MTVRRNGLIGCMALMWGVGVEVNGISESHISKYREGKPESLFNGEIKILCGTRTSGSHHTQVIAGITIDKGDRGDLRWRHLPREIRTVLVISPPGRLQGVTIGEPLIAQRLCRAQVGVRQVGVAGLATTRMVRCSEAVRERVLLCATPRPRNTCQACSY